MTDQKTEHDLLGDPIPAPLPSGERLSYFDQLVGHKILAVFEDSQCAPHVDVVIVTETKCWLVAHADHDGDSAFIVVNDYGHQKSLNDYVKAKDLLDTGCINHGEYDVLRKVEEEREACRTRAPEEPSSAPVGKPGERKQGGAMTDHEKRIREALALNITGDKWESDGAGVYSICDSDLEVAVCFTQDSEDAAFIATCNPSAIRALLADLDAMRGALNRIAAWQEGDEVTPSFDEPHAAAIARNALAGVSDADGAQDAPIPCDVFAGGSLFKKGTPFSELAEHMETEAARLVWAMAHMGMSNDYSRNFTTHVLRVGGIGDIHDCRTFIDAALKGASA